MGQNRKTYTGLKLSNNATGNGEFEFARLYFFIYPVDINCNHIS